MRTRSRMWVAVTTAGLMFAATAGAASAGPGWTDFGPGTGVAPVSYVYNGGPTYDSYMHRSGSGIVHQWLAPGSYQAGAHGAYYLFKPVTTGSVTTPFKASCDTQGLVTAHGVWPYVASRYVPSIASYFPFDGLNYYLCEYDFSNWATGDIYYTVGSDLVRHVVFDVQMPGVGFAGGGTLTYSDTNVVDNYTMTITQVYVTGDTATFAGYYPVGQTTSWMVLQATKIAGTMTWGGTGGLTSVPDLTTFVPTVWGSNLTGTMTFSTR